MKDRMFEAWVAICNNDLVALHRLLSTDSTLIRSETCCKWTLLHRAAMSGTINAVKMLVKNDADVNARDEFYRSVLHLAVQHNTLEVVQFLVESGADINAVTSRDQKSTMRHTPYDFAKAFNKLDIAAWLNSQVADMHKSSESKEELVSAEAVA